MEWAEVINNPLLKDLPFKIELSKFGQIMMSPASNRHGHIQGRMAANLISKSPGKGEVVTECSIQTSDGVKVADVAWASEGFIHAYAFKTPYPKAPEICVDIVSLQTRGRKSQPRWSFIWRRARKRFGWLTRTAK